MSNAVTEEEAKTRWCPFVRVSNGPDGSWNTMQDARSEATYFCRASACMAWRKVSADFDKGGNLPGYCGLAGPVGLSPRA